jgi:hypothetical protein
MALDIQNVAKTAMQPSWNHAFVTFNNQASVLLSMSVPKYKLLFLLHDNRIFAFKREQVSDDASSSSSSSNEQNVLLNLLTTPKYRAMSVIYIIFRLLDNIFFLSIIVLSIIYGGLTTPTAANLALFSTIGLEVFYDVMMQTNKYWILERLSIYIGIVLYGAYAVIVARKNSHGEYTPGDLLTVIVVLITRFVAFIFEECVDIAIDGELHNDLLKLQKQKSKEKSDEISRHPVQNPEQNDDISVHPDQDPEKEERQPLLGEQTYSSLSSWLRSIWIWFKSYMDVSITVKMPQNVNYKGSFFAWSPKSVFTEKEWTEDQFPRWLVYILCFLPFVVTFILLMLLFLLCLVASLIPVILFMLIYFAVAIRYCTFNPEELKGKVMSSNFWKELTHFWKELTHF